MLRRAGRTLSKIGCGVSLLLCIATCVLWMRSRAGAEDHIQFTTNHAPPVRPGPSASREELAKYQLEYEKWSHRDWFIIAGADGSGVFVRRAIGSYTPTLFGVSFSDINIPYWLALIATAAPVVLFIRMWIRSQTQRNAGLCPTCGYDLRASPLRCPECGTERGEVMSDE